MLILHQWICLSTPHLILSTIAQCFHSTMFHNPLCGNYHCFMLFSEPLWILHFSPLELWSLFSPPISSLLASHLFVVVVVNGLMIQFNFGVSGNPAMRQGKPGSGVGLGYGLRFKSPIGHFMVNHAINDFQQRTVYFGISNLIW